MILNMYNIQLRSNQAKNQHTSFHLISCHIPMYPLSGVTKAPLQPPQSRWNLSVLEALTNLQGNLPPHILVCCSTEQRFTAYHIMVLDDQGGWFVSWGMPTKSDFCSLSLSNFIWDKIYMIYLSNTGRDASEPSLPQQDALRLFISAICQSFRSVSFWMVLVKGDALNQSIILGVRCILLHFALVIEDGLFLRNKGINSINMYHSSLEEEYIKGLATTWKDILHMFIEDITLGNNRIHGQFPVVHLKRHSKV